MSKKVAIVDNSRCDRSPFCPAMRVCPKKAIKPIKNEKSPLAMFGLGIVGYEVDKESCTGCGVCVRYCAMGAVEMKEVVEN